VTIQENPKWEGNTEMALSSVAGWEGMEASNVNGREIISIRT
jgi:hypothetical protein